MRDQMIGKLFGNVRGEKAGVRVRDLVDLLVHRTGDIGMTVSQATHRSAAGGIDVSLAGRIEDEYPVPGRRPRQRPAKLTVKNAAHGSVSAAISTGSSASTREASASTRSAT